MGMENQLSDNPDSVVIENRRIAAEYDRRSREIDPDLYAPWQPAEMLMSAGRKRAAAGLLRKAGVFPRRGEPVLEVGCGALGWLGDLITWGLSQENIHGIDLDLCRVSRAREALPVADIRAGDATALPWQAGRFRLVIASTVFSSILNSEVRAVLAKEIARVLAPGGTVLWYDFVYNNPANPNVRKVAKSELKALFPGFEMTSKSVTLAPPLARIVTPISWALATMLEAVPMLRTHLVAVMVKPGANT